MDIIFLIAGASFSFLYILSDSYEKEFNLTKSLFVALTGAIAAMPFGILIYFILMSNSFITIELKISPYLQAISTFIAGIGHKKIKKHIIDKLLKDKDSNGKV